MNELELYQLWNGMWRQTFVAWVTERQMDEVRNYFIRNGMGVEEEKKEEKKVVFKVKSPFLSTAIKELEDQLKLKFVRKKARLV